jgi:hypothetical protein
LKITGIINNVFRPQKNPKKRRIKLYNILAPPSQLCYTAVKIGPLMQDARRITAAEMKYYMRITAEYTWTNHKTNTEERKGLQRN